MIVHPVLALILMAIYGLLSEYTFMANEEAIIRKLRAIDESVVTGAPPERGIQLVAIERESLDDLCPLVAQLSGVNEIDLTSSPVSAAGLQALTPMTEVAILRVSRTGLKGKDFERIESWRRLRSLKCGPFDDGDEALKHIGKLTGLKQLHIERFKFTSQGLKALSGLKQLEKLYFYHCVDVADLSNLGELTALKTVDFLQSQFSDTAIRSIPPLPELTLLGLAYCHITDDIVADLAKHPRLVKLDLRYTPITHEGILRLEHSERWQWLSLSELKMDDRVLPALAKMKNLESLEIDQTDISEAGYQWLQKQLPACRIDWEPRPVE